MHLVSPLSNSAYILLLENLFKNANLSMSSCKILLWFSIAFRIKSRFYKTFKTLHFLIKALFSAISGYLFFFDYITFPLASCLCLFNYVRLIIFFLAWLLYFKLQIWLLLIWSRCAFMCFESIPCILLSHHLSYCTLFIFLPPFTI